MNERIRQLLNEATVGLEPDLSTQRTVTLNEMEKFAELIVRECIQEMTLWERIDLAIRGIKERFGVEERKGWVCPKCGIDRTKDVCPKGHTATMTGDCPMTATAQSGVELK
jgi:hypothetical protein